MVVYSRLHVAMFGAGEVPAPHPLQRVHYCRDASAVLLAIAGSDYVTYAVFEPTVERAAALSACSRLSTWLRSRQADLFMPL